MRERGRESGEEEREFEGGRVGVGLRKEGSRREEGGALRGER